LAYAEDEVLKKNPSRALPRNSRRVALRAMPAIRIGRCARPVRSDVEDCTTKREQVRLGVPRRSGVHRQKNIFLEKQEKCDSPENEARRQAGVFGVFPFGSSTSSRRRARHFTKRIARTRLVTSDWYNALRPRGTSRTLHHTEREPGHANTFVFARSRLLRTSNRLFFLASEMTNARPEE